MPHDDPFLEVQNIFVGFVSEVVRHKQTFGHLGGIIDITVAAYELSVGCLLLKRGHSALFDLDNLREQLQIIDGLMESICESVAIRRKELEGSVPREKLRGKIFRPLRL
jgi:hypothetical protein